MSAANQSFFKAHWDLLVLVGGLAALAGAAFMVVQTVAQSPDEAVGELRRDLDGRMKAPKKTVAPSDLSQLDLALKRVQKPPKLATLDPKKGSFLASEERIFCQNAKCGKPIPTQTEDCPFCREKQNVVKIEADADHDGLPNDWEKKYGFNPDDRNDANLDADGDGFTNLEEYKASTDPKDKLSHPDYLDYLAVGGNIRDTELEFYFEAVRKVRDGYRFTFHRITRPKPTSNKKFTATLGSAIETDDIDVKFKEKSGWKVVSFEEKQNDVKRAGTQQIIKEDAHEVTIERLSDGRKVKLTIAGDKKHADRRKTALESRIDLVWNRGEGRTIKDLAVGVSFSLNERKYKVAKLGKANGAPEVVVLDIASGKEKIIR